jgi:metal-dependent amidase/aminoacylase/carboxypeptidase family protein
MYRGSADVKFVESYPSFSNNDELYKEFYELVLSMDNIDLIDIEKPNMSVEDFSYYTQRIPGIYYKLGCRNMNKGICHPAHGSYFDIDEDCLAYGCAVQTAFAYKYINRI